MLLLQPFWKGDANTDGAGLGLALVKRVADSHGARIKLGSSRYGGAEISLRFRRHWPPIRTGARSATAERTAWIPCGAACRWRVSHLVATRPRSPTRQAGSVRNSVRLRCDGSSHRLRTSFLCVREACLGMAARRLRSGLAGGRYSGQSGQARSRVHSQADQDCRSSIGRRLPRRLVSHDLLPYGLRTVDGSYNNLGTGNELFGSSDQLMPRLLNPVFNPAEARPANLHPGVPAGPQTSYAQNSGSVYDSQPRIISNLISIKPSAIPRRSSRPWWRSATRILMPSSPCRPTVSPTRLR